jgi:hypothetical protein
MTNIQLVLLVNLIVLLVLYLRYFRNRIFNMLFFLTFFMVGIVFVIKPSITMKIAGFFGVGRGVDLIIYLLLLTFFFLFIALFYKTRSLDKTIIELVRRRAVQSARRL